MIASLHLAPGCAKDHAGDRVGNRPPGLARRIGMLAAGLAFLLLLAAAGCASPTPTSAPSTEALTETTQATEPPASPAQETDKPASGTVSSSTGAAGAQPPQNVPASSNPSAFPAAPEGSIQPILATKVLNPGVQRVAFLLAGPRAIIKAPEVSVAASYLGDAQAGPEAPSQMARAVYHGWPYGIRGAYSAELAFDRPGPWRLDVAVEEGEVVGSAVIELEVVAEAPVPGIGERPPLSRTKTLNDVESIEQLTTDYRPDEDMYRISVAEAIESPRPSVVVFSSPAFCTSPTCGPQLDTVKELKAAYQDRADFVHVEIYDFPDEIQGDLSRATLVPTVDEWGLSSLPHWFNESWVFIMSGEGLVEQRFEGYATLTELEEELKQTLGEG